MDKIPSVNRPFYFHTDDSKLNDLFKAVHAQGISPRPVVFPAVQPSDPKISKIWYDNIAKAKYQGWGHVRLML